MVNHLVVVSVVLVALKKNILHHKSLIVKTQKG